MRRLGGRGPLSLRVRPRIKYAIDPKAEKNKMISSQPHLGSFLIWVSSRFAQSINE
jgi:hypothetical protein